MICGPCYHMHGENHLLTKQKQQLTVHNISQNGSGGLLTIKYDNYVLTQTTFIYQKVPIILTYIPVNRRSGIGSYRYPDIISFLFDCPRIN